MTISKMWMVVIIAMVVITLFAASAFVLVNNNPKTPEAMSIVLKANEVEIGGHWNQTMSGGDALMKNNLTSEAYSYMLNESASLSIGIQVFNNETNCHRAMAWDNATSNNIGDENVCSCGDDDIPYVSVVFREANILVLIMLEPKVGNPQWAYDSTIHIAELQSQKIDQYLVQHPGAS